MNKEKLLFVSARLPFPPKEGHQLRSFGLLRQLSKYYEVHLLSILRPGEVIEPSELTEICHSINGVSLKLNFKENIIAGLKSITINLPLVVTRYVNSSLENEFYRLYKEIKPKFVHLDLLPLMHLSHLVSDSSKVILNQHNVESELLLQRLQSLPKRSLMKKLLFYREYLLLKKFEERSCKKADVILSCSDLDNKTIKAMGGKEVYTIPNGVDVYSFNPQYENVKKKHLVFLGGMGWYPNKLGMDWFIKDVLPLILSKKSDIVVDVIGNPEPRLEFPEEFKRNIVIHGFVDDFKELVSQAALMIVPLTVGGGTRLKIVEGAALGKCIVSTSKGAEGVLFEDKKSILLADAPEDFAELVDKYVNDVDEAVAVGKLARSQAENRYDWDIIGSQLESIYSGSNESK